MDSARRCSAFSFLGVSMGIRKGTALVPSPLLVLYIYMLVALLPCYHVAVLSPTRRT